MSHDNRQSDSLSPADAELLEQYLDGRLSSDQAAAAEQRIAENPAFREAVEKQDRINRSLKRLFQAPEPEPGFLETLATSGEAAPAPDFNSAKPERASHTRGMHWAAAASILICAAAWGHYAWRQHSRTARALPQYGERSIVHVYNDAVKSGFKPDWLCEDDKEFAQTFAERQGKGLLLKPLPEGVRMAGLAYLGGLSEKATCMMAYVEESPVLVAVLRTGNASSSLLQLDEHLEVRVFSRELDGLTLVEATPFEEPRVLAFLYRAEVPDKPTGHVPGTRLSE